MQSHPLFSFSGIAMSSSALGRFGSFCWLKEAVPVPGWTGLPSKDREKYRQEKQLLFFPFPAYS